MCVNVIGDSVEFESDGGAVRVRIITRGDCAVEIIFPTRKKFMDAFAGAAVLVENFNEPDGGNVVEFPGLRHADTA